MSDIFSSYIDDMRRRGKLSHVAEAARCTEATLMAARIDLDRLGRDTARRVHGYMRRTGIVKNTVRFYEIFPKWTPDGERPARVQPMSYAEYLVNEVEKGRTTKLILQDVYKRAAPTSKSRIQIGRALRAMGESV